jgi:quercetin dioxygenase-like cupin family protein
VKTINARGVAAEAVTANPTRPATSVICDLPDARLVVFRIAPGQAVAPHSNASTVILTVLAGTGIVTGGDAESSVSAGSVVVYEPNERHGMRAVDEELVLLATIAPRPGARAQTTAIASASQSGIRGSD